MSKMPAASRRRLSTSSEEIADPAPSDLDDLELNLRLSSMLDASSLPPDTDHPSPNTAATPSDFRPAVSSSSDTHSLDQELNCMLSFGTVVSTTSEERTEGQEQGLNTFKKIGAGACGAIFAQAGQPLAVKLAKGDNAALWNDYKKHANIASQFARYGVVVDDQIRVPACYFFVPPQTTSYFDRNPDLVRAAEQIVNFPTAALVSERIEPLPHPTRVRLVEKYCSPRNRLEAVADAANRDCLVRLYLGSTQGKTGGRFFSLRNLKLHLNHMVDIKLDVVALARRMGIAFALMHWAAKTDGRDVEFVLGSSSAKMPVALPVGEIMALEEQTYTGPPSWVNGDFFGRTTEMWLLDFNQVQTITLDDAGVAMAVEAVKLNDPYIPKPLRESAVEKKIWEAFVDSYLKMSDTVLEEEGARLPRKFIAGITELERERMQRREP